MKKITTTMKLAVASACLLFGSAVPAMIELPNPSEYESQLVKTPINMLFVIEAKHGALVHTAGKQYKLIIPVADIKSVLAFSEHPNRISFSMTPGEFHKMVFNGTNDFGTNPPNIVLSWADQNHSAEAYTVLAHEKSHGFLTYTLNKLNGQAVTKQNQRGAVTLYVDGEGVDSDFDGIYNPVCEAQYGDKDSRCAVLSFSL